MKLYLFQSDDKTFFSIYQNSQGHGDNYYLCAPAFCKLFGLDYKTKYPRIGLNVSYDPENADVKMEPASGSFGDYNFYSTKTGRHIMQQYLIKSTRIFVRKVQIKLKSQVLYLTITNKKELRL